MRNRLFEKNVRSFLTFRNPVFLAIVSVLLCKAPTEVRAVDIVILPGWDLLQTASPTSFLGFPFEGVPLNTFDFGGTIGVKPVGNYDTIMRRTTSASVPEPVPPSQTDTVPIELVALQLKSVNPIDLGAGTRYYYITLQSTHGGTASTGQMDVTFDSPNGGTFDSFFDVFYDVRIDAIDGTIVNSGSKHFVQAGAAWDRDPEPGTILIPDVNYHLNGSNNTNDFFLDGFALHDAGDSKHGVIPTPEPGSLVMIAAGSLTMCVVGLFRSRRKGNSDRK